MTHPQLAPIVGVTAAWVIFLSSIRFAAAGGYGIWPVVTATGRLKTCR